MLGEECRRAKVEIVTSANVTEVRRSDRFVVETNRGGFEAPALVVATGGLSIPKIGATPFGYELARQFGVKICDTRPALVPLTFDPQDLKRYADLSGVSSEVVASFDGSGRGPAAARFREQMLITHRGLSGPAILQVSSYWRPGEPIMLDLAPERDVTSALRASPSGRDANAAKAALRAALPARMAERWIDLHPPANWTNAALAEFERNLHRWNFLPAGTEGYEKAEVTAGGVDTGELSAKTMEAKRMPGLYFIGEVIDVTGHLGGFNFQWAWASGFCAGRAI
jgi:predicted Rossmann fold flavoprotein